MKTQKFRLRSIKFSTPRRFSLAVDDAGNTRIYISIYSLTGTGYANNYQVGCPTGPTVNPEQQLGEDIQGN
jgi:hypothetical protein